MSAIRASCRSRSRLDPSIIVSGVFDCLGVNVLITKLLLVDSYSHSLMVNSLTQTISMVSLEFLTKKYECKVYKPVVDGRGRSSKYDRA